MFHDLVAASVALAVGIVSSRLKAVDTGNVTLQRVEPKRGFQPDDHLGTVWGIFHSHSWKSCLVGDGY